MEGQRGKMQNIYTSKHIYAHMRKFNFLCKCICMRLCVCVYVCVARIKATVCEQRKQTHVVSVKSRHSGTIIHRRLRQLLHCYFFSQLGSCTHTNIYTHAQNKCDYGDGDGDGDGDDDDDDGIIVVSNVSVYHVATTASDKSSSNNNNKVTTVQ